MYRDLKTRQIPHHIIVVSGHFKRIIVAFDKDDIAVIDIVTAVLAGAAFAFHFDGQFNHVVLIVHGIKIPFISLRKERPPH